MVGWSLAKVASAGRYMLFSALVTAYLVTFFFRVSASVVLPVISSEWGMSATLTSLISSLYFYAYAAMQPLSGVLNDRLGPSRVAAYGLIIGGAGSAIFGFAGSPIPLALGRLLIGLGLAPMLSGCLVYSGAHFDKSNYSTNSGITFFMGNLGAVIAVAPLGAALDAWGREAVFIFMAALAALLSVVVALLGKNDRLRAEGASNHLRVGQAFGHIVTSARLIMKSKGLFAASYIWAASLGPLLALQGLWAVSWSSAAYPGDLGAARLWATMIGLGLMAGNSAGALIRLSRMDRVRTLRVVVVLLGICWVEQVAGMAVGFAFFLTSATNFMIGFLTGLCNTYLSAVINDKAPEGWGGSVFGLANMAAFILTIAAQTGTGFIIDAVSKGSEYSAASFSAAFSVVSLVALSSVLFIRRLDS